MNLARLRATLFIGLAACDIVGTPRQDNTSRQPEARLPAIDEQSAGNGSPTSGADACTSTMRAAVVPAGFQAIGRTGGLAVGPFHVSAADRWGNRQLALDGEIRLITWQEIDVRPSDRATRIIVPIGSLPGSEAAEALWVREAGSGGYIVDDGRAVDLPVAESEQRALVETLRRCTSSLLARRGCVSRVVDATGQVILYSQFAELPERGSSPEAEVYWNERLPSILHGAETELRRLVLVDPAAVVAALLLAGSQNVSLVGVQTSGERPQRHRELFSFLDALLAAGDGALTCSGPEPTTASSRAACTATWMMRLDACDGS